MVEEPAEPSDPLALAALLDDLEARAESAFQADRDDELADRSRSEYLQVTLAARLMAEVGHDVSLEVHGVGALHGTIDRVGTGWLLLRLHRAEWLIRQAAIMTVRGSRPRAVPEIAWPVTARLGLGSALRGLAEAGTPCVVHLTDGGTVEGVLARVGADFVEVVGADGRVTLTALAALAAVRHA